MHRRFRLVSSTEMRERITAVVLRDQWDKLKAILVFIYRAKNGIRYKEKIKRIRIHFINSFIMESGLQGAANFKNIILHY